MVSGAKPGGAGDHWVHNEITPRKVRVVFGGETIAESKRAMLMLEAWHTPVYYFPQEDVRMDLMTRTDHSTHWPVKGDASYWSISVLGKTAENAVWSYEDPIESVPELKDYVSFYWKMMDAWYEEDEEIFLHPRDPYKRVDVIQSSRHVRIVAGGETLAESARPRLLFETGCPTRYYLPEEDVRMDLLSPSEKTSICPYKGEAVYWSARAGGEILEDVVWSYPGPVPECPKIKGLLSFYNERVDDIFVDGEAIEKSRD